MDSVSSAVWLAFALIVGAAGAFALLASLYARDRRGEAQARKGWYLQLTQAEGLDAWKANDPHH